MKIKRLAERRKPKIKRIGVRNVDSDTWSNFIDYCEKCRRGIPVGEILSEVLDSFLVWVEDQKKIKNPRVSPRAPVKNQQKSVMQ
jgi:hypothetical protein